MTRKAGAHRCAVCGHPAAEAVPPGACDRCHGEARSLHGKEPVTPGRGLPPFDLVSGTTDVVRSVFTIVLGRAFVGRLRRPLWVNAIAFLLLLGLFAFALLPAFESGAGNRNPAFWAFASWVLLAPVGLELLAGPWQNGL
ncbi:MAG: hypothetical protein KDE27_30750, partial [Planctomycetes bacterium]|nr:hypothetical protein [Planctomycetota bacterium]